MVGATLWMTLAIPLYLEQAIDLLRGAQHDQVQAGAAFNTQVAWIMAFAVAIIITRTASRLLFFIPGRRVEYDLKNRLLGHLTTLQRGYFLTNPSGSIISRVNNDINGVRMLMGFGLLQLVNSIALLSLAPYQMYLISPELTAYVVGPLLLAFFFTAAGIAPAAPTAAAADVHPATALRRDRRVVQRPRYIAQLPGAGLGRAAF